MDNSNSLYQRPLIYDLAFSYRNFPFEVDFILDTYRSLRSGEPLSFVELAAGPADHAIEAASRGLDAVALDLSLPMKNYGLQKATERGQSIRYIVDNMCTFNLGQRFDLIVTMLDSLSHITNTESLVTHFQSVERHLSTNGLYIIEVSHPKSIFLNERTTQEKWSIEKNDSIVKMSWKVKNPIDPISQNQTYTVNATYTDSKIQFNIEDEMELRIHTKGELELALGYCSSLKILQSYGDFKKIPLDHQKAWRMILVVGKGQK